MSDVLRLLYFCATYVWGHVATAWATHQALPVEPRLTYEKLAAAARMADVLAEDSERTYHRFGTKVNADEVEYWRSRPPLSLDPADHGAAMIFDIITRVIWTLAGLAFGRVLLDHDWQLVSLGLTIAFFGLIHFSGRSRS